MNGTGYQFPGIGMASWENLVTNRKPGKNTVVLGLEDGSATNSHVHMWLGEKQATGNAFEKAGFAKGNLYVLNVPSAANDNVFRTVIGKNKKTSVEFREVNWNQTISNFDKSVTAAGTEFARVEDGEWDPNDPNVFYFLTTESNKDPVATAPNPAFPTVSRDGGALWRLTFKDAQNPLLGADLELLLNGGESMYLSKPDNLAITKSGVIMIQEDPGNNDALSRIVAYRIKDGAMATVAQFDETYFSKTGAKFITIDEESSGIIDITEMMPDKKDGKTYFLLNAQIHSTLMKARPDLFRTNAMQTKLENIALEGGQYYLMSVGNWDSIFKS
jgi:secreted PhoX family phosphatase